MKKYYSEQFGWIDEAKTSVQTQKLTLLVGSEAFPVTLDAATRIVTETGEALYDRNLDNATLTAALAIHEAKMHNLERA